MKITFFFLLFSFAIPFSYSLSFAADCFYVDPAKGSNRAKGTREEPFQSVEHALNLLSGKGGEIHLAPGSLLREPIRIIRKSGLPDSPIILDGHGSVVNLGTDLTAGPWTKVDDGYRYEKEVPRNRVVYQVAVVFVNGIPLVENHPSGKVPHSWHGGSARYDDTGKLVVLFPKGLDPTNSVIVRPGKDDGMSGLLVNGSSHIVVRNLTAVFAGNDGFNFHGQGENFRLENATALFNADEGMSSHETYQVDVRDSEVAFCGSIDGGVVDVNDSETTYDNLRCHQNRGGGFKMIGRKHLLKKCLSYGNWRDNLPKPDDKVSVVDCKDEGTPESEKTVPVFTNQTVPPAAEIKESDRMSRFLLYRP